MANPEGKVNTDCRELEDSRTPKITYKSMNLGSSGLTETKLTFREPA